MPDDLKRSTRRWPPEGLRPELPEFLSLSSVHRRADDVHQTVQDAVNVNSLSPFSTTWCNHSWSTQNAAKLFRTDLLLPIVRLKAVGHCRRFRNFASTKTESRTSISMQVWSGRAPGPENQVGRSIGLYVTTKYLKTNGQTGWRSTGRPSGPEPDSIAC